MLKWLLVGSIRAYQSLPARFKRRCIFKETCSRYVLRHTLESGFWAGVRALRYRIGVCRPLRGAEFASDGEMMLMLADGSRAPSYEFTESAIQPYSVMRSKLFEGFSQ